MSAIILLSLIVSLGLSYAAVAWVAYDVGKSLAESDAWWRSRGEPTMAEYAALKPVWKYGGPCTHDVCDGEPGCLIDTDAL